MKYVVSLLLAALFTGWICGVPYCGPGAVAVAAIAFAWEPRRQP